MTRSARILVVDDEAVVCKSVERILGKSILDVETVLSADAALEQLGKNEYAVVITDMMMPKISGMELLARIKKRNPGISVIMITGYATVRTAVTAIKLGAFDYIPKPFTPEELTAVTLRALERSRLFREQEKNASPEAPGEEPPPEEPPVVEVDETDAEYVRLNGGARRYRIPEHAWASVESDGNVRIGAEDMFQRTAGDIINVDLPFEGDEVYQGEVCVRITATGLHIHKLWSPVSGKVVRVNAALGQEPSLVNSDPYGKGWIVRVMPEDLDEDLKNLEPADPQPRNGANR